MSDLSIFNFYDHIIRTIFIGGEIWFVAVDVCAVLGIKNPRDALTRLDDDEKQTIPYNSLILSTVGTTDGAENQQLSENRKINVVNESGLYSLTFVSKKPNAKQFRKWVTKEVLPTIRKTGQYSTHANKLTEALTWEQQRQAGKAVRADFTDTLTDHGVTGFGFAQCTNGIYRKLLGNTASKLKAQRGVPKKASLRDAMSGEELIASAFAEIVASQRIDANEDQGNSPCYQTCKASGEAVSSLLVKKLK